ncbi:MAG: pyruvate formate lyase activating enzyme, partial [Candidatus Azotimanducaceae bacterium]
PGCREQVIGRDRYQLGEWNLDAQSCCLACGTRVAGVFEEKPADWGPKRLPIKIKTKTSS